MSLFGLTEEQIEVVLEYCNNKNIIDYIVNKLNISQKVNNEEDFFELVILCADRYSSAEVDVLSHLEANKYDKSKTQPIYINDNKDCPFNIATLIQEFMPLDEIINYELERKYELGNQYKKSFIQ